MTIPDSWVPVSNWTPSPLSVSLCFGMAFCALSALLNAVAVVAMLNSWHRFRRRANEDRGENMETVGYFVFLFVLFSDLMFLLFGKVSFLHGWWHSSVSSPPPPPSFLLGPAVCAWSRVADAAFAAAPAVALSLYLGHAWLQTSKSVHSYTAPQNSEAVVDRVSRSQPRQAAIIVAAALAWSVAVASVIAYRMDLDSSAAAVRLCLSSPPLPLPAWLTAFRWLLGDLGPALLIGAPATARILCSSRRRRQRRSGFPRCLSLAVSATTIHLLLALPALALDLERLRGDLGAPAEEASVAAAASVDALRDEAEHARRGTGRFIGLVLSRMLPELRLLYLPAGVLIVLPVRLCCRCYCCCCCGGGNSCDVADKDSSSAAVLTETPPDKRWNFPNGRHHHHHPPPSSNSSSPYSTLKARRRLMPLEEERGWLKADDDEEEEEGGEEEVGVVTAMVHQSPARSRTTVV